MARVSYSVSTELEPKVVWDALTGQLLRQWRLPQSRVAVMPGQQHAAINTAPDLFLREVLGFLRT